MKHETQKDDSMKPFDPQEHLKKYNMTEWNKEEYLSKLYDKQLKDLRTKTYAHIRGRGEQDLNDNEHYDVSRNNLGWFVSKDDVMAELSTRGDIPNVKEAKTIRQQRAKKRF